MDNIFKGESYKVLFAKEIYKQLRTGEWFSHSSVMLAFLRNKDPKLKQLPCSVACCDYYVQLKKAFCEVKKAIEDRTSNKNFLEERGNNRKGKEFRYVGSISDPLRDQWNASVVLNLDDYTQFCIDSAGFFPPIWINHFFKGSLDLSQMNNNRESIMSSVDRKLENIELLPEFYSAIKKHKVLSFEYPPFYNEKIELVFHPHI